MVPQILPLTSPYRTHARAHSHMHAGPTSANRSATIMKIRQQNNTTITDMHQPEPMYKFLLQTLHPFEMVGRLSLSRSFTDPKPFPFPCHPQATFAVSNAATTGTRFVAQGSASVRHHRHYCDGRFNHHRGQRKYAAPARTVMYVKIRNVSACHTRIYCTWCDRCMMISSVVTYKYSPASVC